MSRSALLELLRLGNRTVYLVPDLRPACFFLADLRAGGILVNGPPFSSELWTTLSSVAPPAFLFLPSHLGATDLSRWRDAGVRLIAAAEEAPALSVPVDEVVDGGVRFYGRLDFLPLSGRTRGTCALRVREAPAMLFLGPALDHDPWPALIAHEDDYSFENRLIGALGLRGDEFEYAFCDNFEPGISAFGPGSGAAVRQNLDRLLEI